MSLLQALLLGLVQGITEFLPVSSSGHLAIMQNLLNINTDTGVLFDVILHLGTLTAIFIAFWKDIKKLILDGCGMIYDIIQNIKIWSHNRREHDARRYRKIVSSNYRKFILLITVSTIPTAIVGLLLQNVVETAGSNLLHPGLGFLSPASCFWWWTSSRQVTKYRKMYPFGSRWLSAFFRESPYFRESPGPV